MDVQLLTVLVTAVVSVGTTLVVGFYGPAWKDRLDTRRAAQQRSEQVIALYSEPLARAAFDLQSRLYNIRRQAFMTNDNISADYRRLSTLWVFGQFLAWVEIVRREVQVIDFGDLRRTTALQRHLFEVVDILATGGIGDRTFCIFRAEQRAIGELMVTDRSMGDRRRSDSLGYGEFVRRFEADPDFARWFDGLDRDVERLMRGDGAQTRISLTQRALIGLIDFIDPDWVRFPDPDERGRIPMPEGSRDPKRSRAGSEFARFRFGDDPTPMVEAWARERGLSVRQDSTGTPRATLPRRLRPARHDLVLLRPAPPWVEVHVVRRAEPVAAPAPSPDGDPAPRPPLTDRELDAVNALLRRFDRPTYPQRRTGR